MELRKIKIPDEYKATFNDTRENSMLLWMRKTFVQDDKVTKTEIILILNLNF